MFKRQEFSVFKNFSNSVYLKLLSSLSRFFNFRDLFSRSFYVPLSRSQNLPFHSRNTVLPFSRLNLDSWLVKRSLNSSYLKLFRQCKTVIRSRIPFSNSKWSWDSFTCPLKIIQSFYQNVDHEQIFFQIPVAKLEFVCVFSMFDISSCLNSTNLNEVLVIDNHLTKPVNFLFFPEKNSSRQISGVISLSHFLVNYLTNQLIVARIHLLFWTTLPLFASVNLSSR